MKIQSVFLIAFVLVIIVSLFAPVQAAGAKGETFFIAVDGNDCWSGQRPEPNWGRTDGPFATLEAACEAARKLGTKQPRKTYTPFMPSAL